MKKSCTILTLLATFFAQTIWAQVVGGDNVYEFLNLSPSARVTGLAGNLITVRDDDVALAYNNPAALNPEMSGKIQFGNNFYLSDINHGYVSYGQYAKKWDLTFHGGIQYISYGTFQATDEVGNITGQFDAGEYAFTVGAGKELYERLSVGANLKFITSQFESYNSAGMTADLAAMFHDTAKLVNVTLLLKNIGTQFSTYTPGNRESIPFEMQIGVSKQLRYLPFRLSVIYRYLDKWNITYDDPNSQEDVFFIGDGNTTSDNNFIDNLARHFIFNGEFLFGKKENFRMRLGYSHLNRKELTVRNLRSLAGFAFGVGLKINRFRIDFGQGFTHLGAGQTHLGISTNFKEFTKK
ncbi:MAG: type IX secretion system protein PorQ [Saprospiraceae bacterium]